MPAPLRGGTGSPGATLVSPMPLAPPLQSAAVAQAAPVVPAGHVALAVAARYGHDAPLISGGLIWRVYAAKPDATGVFRLVKEERAAAPTFVLPPGNYVVHASFGLASAAKAVQLRSETVREVLDIPAGGVRLEGRVGDVRIPTGQISFDIYPGSQFDTSRPPADRAERHDRRRRAAARRDLLHRLELWRRQFGGALRRACPAGQADRHRRHPSRRGHHAQARQRSGGEALANTQWTVLTPGGDVIKESIGAFPRVVLAEGDYHLIARNEGKTYQRDFKVITGVDGEVEVLAH